MKFLNQLITPFRRASTGTLAAAGEIAYDDATGALRYRDGVNNQDRYLGQFGSQIVPMARVTHNAAQSVPDWNTTRWNPLAFNTETDDTNAIHDTVTSNSRLTCQTPGRYLIFGAVEWAANATGMRFLAIRKNGATFEAKEYVPTVTAAGEITPQAISTEVTLAVGDYVELCASQSSGAALNVTVLADDSPIFGMVWLGGPGNTVTDPSTPAARATVGPAGTQSIAASTAAAVLFPNEDFDNDTMHDTATNTSRLTCRTPGVYTIVAFLRWASDVTTGNGQIEIRKNGVALAPAYDGSIAVGTRTGLMSAQLKLAVNDYIELWATAGSGAAQVVDHASLAANYEGSGKTVIPRARIYRSAALNLANGAWTKFPLDAIENGLDNDLMFDAANGRLVCKTAGSYQLSGQVCFANNTTGANRLIAIAVNGIAHVENSASSAGSQSPRAQASGTWDLAVGDYVELFAYQDTGAVMAMSLTDASFPGTPASNLNWLAAIKVGQSGPGFNNDPGWAQSGTDLYNTNSGDIRLGGAASANKLGRLKGFQAHLSANTAALTANTPTKIAFNTKDFDTNTWYDATTNFRFQPALAGYYRVTLSLIFAAGPAAGQFIDARIYKNGGGSPIRRSLSHYGGTANANGVECTAMVLMNGSTDYLEGWGTTQTSVACLADSGTYFEAEFVGS